MEAGQMSAIKVHLSICDFCNAEAEFYRRFPDLREEEASPAEMPRHLFELASSLMRKRRRADDLESLLPGVSELDSGLN